MVEKDSIQKSLERIEKTDQNSLEAMRQTLAETAKALNLIGTEKITDILGGVLESMPSLAVELGKATPIITIEDHGIVVRNQVNGLLKNMATHLFRNSIDHGIESPEERQANGKTPEGHIYLECSLSGGRFWMKMHDDGKGLAIDRIRQIGLAKGLLGKDETPAPESIAELIFISGFSTAEQVTEVSGRGVGMDAIKGFLEREEGAIKIQFLDDNIQAEFRPFQIVISLPEKYAVQADSQPRV
jgi:chemotaxis protein histidine kinase CheA